jgi:hypothetical protein
MPFNVCDVASYASCEAQKVLSATSDVKKKPTEKQMAQMKDSMMAGHDTVAGMAGADLEGIGSQLIGGASSSDKLDWRGAFNDEGGVNAVNVRSQIVAQLKPTDVEEDEVGDAGEVGSKDAGKKRIAETDASGSKETPTKKKKPVRFETDRHVSNYTTSWAIDMENLKNGVIKVLAEMICAHAKYSQIEGAALITLSLKAVLARKLELQLIFPEGLDTDNFAQVEEAENALREKIKRWSSGTEARPTQTHDKLMLLYTLADFGSNQIATISSKEDLTAVQLNLNPKRDAVKELIGCCSTVLKDLVKNAKNLSSKLCVEVSSTKQAGAQGSGNAALAPVPLLWDFAGDVALTVSTFGAFDAVPVDVDLSKPFMVTGTDAKSQLEAVDGFMDFVADFKGIFAKHALRETEGRAQKRMEGKLAEVAESLMKGLVPDSRLIKIAPAVAAKCLPLTAYACVMKPSTDFYVTEFHHTASVRMNVDGNRKVLCSRFGHLRDFLSTESTVNPGTIDAQRAFKFLKRATKEQLTAYASKYPMFCFTCGPGDLVYLPCAMIIAEVGQHVGDITCIRHGVVVDDRDGIASLDGLIKREAKVDVVKSSKIVLDALTAHVKNNGGNAVTSVISLANGGLGALGAVPNATVPEALVVAPLAEVPDPDADA